MKVAVSAMGKEKESLLDKRFGRCEYFLIFDTESEEVRAIGNNGISSSGGAGIAAASQVIEEQVSAVITGNLGPNAYELIEKAGVKAYTCQAMPAFQAFEMLKENQLAEISHAGSSHAGFHGGF